MRREIHIEAERASELVDLLADLELNSDCDPHNVPLGTICYWYPWGLASVLERTAQFLGISYAWGIIPQKVIATAVASTKLFALQTPFNLLSIFNISNPSAMSQTASYDLTTFLVQQVYPSAVAVNTGATIAYVQNADDSVAPSSNSFFVVYDVSNPLVVVQQGSINLGLPTATRANEGNALVASGTTVWSLLGGDATTNAAKLRKINASNPAAPVVATGPVSVGTFADQPRALALSADGLTLYVLSGTPATANQKVFVYNATTLTLTTTLTIGNAAALVGLRNFFERSGLLYMIAGDGIASATNLVVYDTSGIFKSATLVTTGPSGLAIAGPVA